MENSIEKRAKEYAPDPVDPDCILPAREGYIVNQQRDAYIAGATEQRDIDVARIREFLEREAAYNGSMSCVDDLLIEELCKAIGEQI